MSKRYHQNSRGIFFFFFGGGGGGGGDRGKNGFINMQGICWIALTTVAGMAVLLGQWHAHDTDEHLQLPSLTFISPGCLSICVCGCFTLLLYFDVAINANTMREFDSLVTTFACVERYITPSPLMARPNNCHGSSNQSAPQLATSKTMQCTVYIVSGRWRIGREACCACTERY